MLDRAAISTETNISGRLVRTLALIVERRPDFAATSTGRPKMQIRTTVLPCVIAAAAALSMTSCSGVEGEPVAGPTTTTTTTSAATSAARTPVNTRDEYGDLQFLLTVRDAGVVGSDAALVGAAQDICTGVAASGIQTTSELFDLLRTNLVPGIDMMDAVSVATAGILHYCPEHSNVLNS
ncbi:DUF732 domain-containing protein [Rhodococcus sp. BP-241]|uniref:DUF732 domain-containing protein n=1 Tax=Rhodococcus sp. BP-241 TaxID=2739441 RepID=UPI001C9B0790|nr:DUF732 domain-containing protein [Rhodococcus sp. BP-241]MBY6706212.1 DUF732 domain-containing protein [Rhodococcus sp. BP-241]